MTLVSNLCENNYNVWATISINSKLLIKLARKAGLKEIKNPELIKKILINHYPESIGKIKVEKLGAYSVFTKTGSNDKPQVLMLS